MESQPTPPASEEVHVLPPENLPKELKNIAIQAVQRKYTEAQKINVVMHLIESGKPTKEIAEHYGLSPPILRGWSQAYNVKARRLMAQIKNASESAKRVEEIQAAHKSATAPSPKAQRVRRNYSTDDKKTMVERHIKSGLGTRKGAATLGIHETLLRRWIKEYRDGPKKEKGVKPMAIATSNRTLSEREKLLVAARYSEMETTLSAAALQLHVSESALRSWYGIFMALKPQKKGALLRELHGNQYKPQKGHGHNTSKYEEGTKQKALEEIKAGARLIDLAVKYKAHPDTIRNWWKKLEGNKPLPVVPGQRPYNPSTAMSAADKEKLIKRWEAGESSTALAKEFGIAGTTVRGWWELFRPNKPRPPNAPTHKGRVPGTKNKKTLKRMAIAAAVTGQQQAELIDAVGEKINGAAQPISTGKATHDAIVFLRMARDAAQKSIVAGRVQLDDPMVLFPMLALHTLNT